MHAPPTKTKPASGTVFNRKKRKTKNKKIQKRQCLSNIKQSVLWMAMLFVMIVVVLHECHTKQHHSEGRQQAKCAQRLLATFAVTMLTIMMAMIVMFVITLIMMMFIVCSVDGGGGVGRKLLPVFENCFWAFSVFISQ